MDVLIWDSSNLDCDRDPVVGCLTTIPPSSPLLLNSLCLFALSLLSVVVLVFLQHCSEEIDAFLPTLADPPHTLRHSFISPSTPNKVTDSPSFRRHRISAIVAGSPCLKCEWKRVWILCPKSRSSEARVLRSQTGIRHRK